VQPVRAKRRQIDLALMATEDGEALTARSIPKRCGLARATTLDRGLGNLITPPTFQVAFA
jgi:hypothetical protein